MNSYHQGKGELAVWNCAYLWSVFINENKFSASPGLRGELDDEVQTKHLDRTLTWRTLRLSRCRNDSFFPLLNFCLPLNCGSLGSGEGHWGARWLINWEAQRPLTPMMQGDRADEERRLASSFSGWTCHQWCSRVEKGSGEQKLLAFFSPRFSFLCFSSRFCSSRFLFSSLSSHLSQIEMEFLRCVIHFKLTIEIPLFLLSYHFFFCGVLPY